MKSSRGCVRTDCQTAGGVGK
uniref:Uncharacterized protein n=1 Tax=Anguilla anguilla TaxID=7936 RepID=A0A0E9VGE3_ANGAN